MGGDGANGHAQLPFNALKFICILAGYQIYCQTKMTKTTRSANSMQVGLGRRRKVKINHNIDSGNIDTAIEQIYAKKCKKLLRWIRNKNKHLENFVASFVLT